MPSCGLPPPVIIRKRKFRVRRQLESFKQRMLRRAIEQRAEAAIAREVGAKHDLPDLQTVAEPSFECSLAYQRHWNPGSTSYQAADN